MKVAQKALIQREVPDDADLFEEILQLIHEHAWIYISSNLLAQLEEKYQINNYEVGWGGILRLKKFEKEFKVFIDRDSNWSKIKTLSEEEKGKVELYETCDPESVVFLY